MNKRSFLKKLSLLGAGTTAFGQSMANWIQLHEGQSAEQLAADETFWEGIRAGYALKPDYINLENGYYCIQPQEILNKYLQHIKDVNLQGAYYMRTVQWKTNRKLRQN